MTYVLQIVVLLVPFAQSQMDSPGGDSVGGAADDSGAGSGAGAGAGTGTGADSGEMTRGADSLGSDEDPSRVREQCRSVVLSIFRYFFVTHYDALKPWFG